MTISSYIPVYPFYLHKFAYLRNQIGKGTGVGVFSLGQMSHF